MIEFNNDWYSNNLLFFTDNSLSFLDFDEKSKFFILTPIVSYNRFPDKLYICELNYTALPSGLFLNYINDWFCAYYWFNIVIFLNDLLYFLGMSEQLTSSYIILSWLIGVKHPTPDDKFLLILLYLLT